MLLGRHLIERRLTPGPQFGAILDAAFDAQLEGEFGDLEGAGRWLDRWLAREKVDSGSPNTPGQCVE
jgi:tRNA nucleotidyltransferase (CCA-adding enzyme)